MRLKITVLFRSDFSRVVNLGFPSRALATRDPTSQDLLPVDDLAWDEGVSNPLLLYSLYWYIDDYHYR